MRPIPTTPLLAALATIASCTVTGGEAPPRVFRDPDTGIELVSLPGGRFRMGSPPDEPGRQDDETLHEVVLRPYLLGRYEVTQAEWRRILGSSPSQHADCGPRCPVESISFDDALALVAALNRRSRTLSYRLPSEAEWEHACRAGTTTAYSTGAILSTAAANFDGRFPLPGTPPGRYRGRPVAVGSFPANPWGIHDLHGNVWEWTADAYGPYPAGPADDPRRPEGNLRVIRGGSWAFDAASARSALRYTHARGDSGWSLGLRLAADPRPSR